MNRDQLRQYLNFYQDLGVKSIYRHTAPAAPPEVRPTPPELRPAPPALLPLAPPGETLDAIRAALGDDCRRCRLCEARSRIVFGSGSEQARLVFVGVHPGPQRVAVGRGPYAVSGAVSETSP